MKKECAIEIHKCAIEAIKQLAQIPRFEEGNYKEYETIRKATGICIGKIQMDILEVLTELYPELDDLGTKKLE